MPTPSPMRREISCLHETATYLDRSRDGGELVIDIASAHHETAARLLQEGLLQRGGKKKVSVGDGEKGTNKIFGGKKYSRVRP